MGVAVVTTPTFATVAHARYGGVARETSIEASGEKRLFLQSNQREHLA